MIVGSFGGSAQDPAWVGNLRAEPRALLRRGRQVGQVDAHEVVGPERERLWRLVCQEFPLYETYQRRAKRTIPLFVLEPAGAQVRRSEAAKKSVNAFSARRT